MQVNGDGSRTNRNQVIDICGNRQEHCITNNVSSQTKHHDDDDGCDDDDNVNQNISLASRLRLRLGEHLPSFSAHRRNTFATYTDTDLFSDSNNEPKTSTSTIYPKIAAARSPGAAPTSAYVAIAKASNMSGQFRKLPVSFPPHLSELKNQTSRASVVGVGGTITTVTKDKRTTAPLPRLVSKNGTVNLFVNNIDRRQYIRDLFTTMIDIKWRYNLLAAAIGFVVSWVLFACVWYLVLYAHQDLTPPQGNWSPCIEKVTSFSEAFLFSIETQSTLGFGTRIISVECPGAILIFCIQIIVGVVVECLIVGMVFAKLSRPTKRSQTIMFSKFATVCLRDDELCLAFRVGDVRSKSHIIGATTRVSLVSQKITKEGELIPFYHYKLDVKIDDSQNSLLLIWPVIIVHAIDESSPFFALNREEFENFNFELIVMLEGTIESTGQSIQVRSSYLPSEIKWGHRFESLVSTHGFGKYAQTTIDYNKFNKTVAVDTPSSSARDYYKHIYNT